MNDLIDFAALQTSPRRDAERYAAAQPFPHIVIETFLTRASLANAIAEFPSPEAIQEWRRADAVDANGRIAQARKLGYSQERHFGPTLRALVHELNSGPFLRYLEQLTGIDHLIPDPHMVGGGLHQYLPGAVLRVHADFNRLPGVNLDRRLNLLLYLNAGWQPQWGGDLELWDASMQRCASRIAPLANRCVIFSTTSTSYHGMPEPLASPSRRHPALTRAYYYSNGRPAEERVPDHSTLWQTRPHEGGLDAG